MTPLLVPHRDEFSETVGYKIEGPSKTVLFIPDIDKWLLWDQNLIDLLETGRLTLIYLQWYGSLRGFYKFTRVVL